MIKPFKLNSPERFQTSNGEGVIVDTYINYDDAGNPVNFWSDITVGGKSWTTPLVECNEDSEEIL